MKKVEDMTPEEIETLGKLFINFAEVFRPLLEQEIEVLGKIIETLSELKRTLS